MRIGISTSVIQRGQSGVGQYVLALVRALVARAQDHEFFLFTLEQDLPLFEFARGHLRLVPVPEAVRPPLKNISWHQFVLPNLARRLNLEVLHVPSYRRMCWAKPCALVATIHDLAPFRVPKKYDWLRMWYGRVAARALAHRQDEVIAVSENTARDLVACFGLSRTRISVVHNGLEHERFHPGHKGHQPIETSRWHGQEKPFFLYVARLEHPGKNHVRLVEAFNRFKAATGSEWRLMLAGSDWQGVQAIRAAVKRSPFCADILLPGFVPDGALPDLYRAAGVFIYPSLYEGFGMPPVEAMACGCPVICSARGALAEVVGQAAAIVEPESVESIAAQMRALAGDELLRQRLRAAGLERARQFDWKKTADETLQVFQRAAARRQLSRRAGRWSSAGAAPDPHRIAG